MESITLPAVSPTELIDVSLATKRDQLRASLADLGPSLVAFSAGVDSSYLLAEAHAVLGDQVVAVTADSPSLARRSLAEATAFCAERGIAHRIVHTDEFEDPSYVANSGQRCYACKAALFRAMDLLVAASDGTQALLLGALSEDFQDYRPGLQAAREAGARWPLADAGLTKPEVRALSRDLGLPTWDRPAEPCLSSRIPYGEPVTVEALRMIEAAEQELRRAGFRECRARHHAIGDSSGYLCRLEVPTAELNLLLAQREGLLARIRAIGYLHVALDLGGLQSGAFNALVQPTSTAVRPTKDVSP